MWKFTLDSLIPFDRKFKRTCHQIRRATRQARVQPTEMEKENPEANNFKNNKFFGLPSEYPNFHIRNFLEISDIVKYNGISDEVIKLWLYKFQWNVQHFDVSYKKEKQNHDHV